MTSSSTTAAPVILRRVLKALQIPERERSCFQEVRDQQPGRSAEQIEEVANQALAELALVDGGLEQLRVADLLYLAHRTLLLEAVNQRLNGSVSNALLLGQAVENLAHGAGAELPVLLQDSR